MSEQEGAKPIWHKNKNLFFAIAGGLFLCCIVTAILIFLTISSKSLPVFLTGNVKPPHYGVFLKQNNELTELSEREIFDIPTTTDLESLEMTSEALPKLVVWRTTTNLDYLKFYKIGQHIGEAIDINYVATPLDEEVIEIMPDSRLDFGVYCLIQGNPQTVFLPGWCFEVSSLSKDEWTELSGTVVLDEQETFNSADKGIQLNYYPIFITKGETYTATLISNHDENNCALHWAIEQLNGNGRGVVFDNANKIKTFTIGLDDNEYRIRVMTQAIIPPTVCEAFTYRILVVKK